ncbi:MAG: hypothetical protein RLO12_18700 [Fulvivirga sp.]|uniref:hypothetical protein n=1 Tax=Fulvivirga sp. TaxID=1931237 RepID=UPI0032F8E34C
MSRIIEKICYACILTILSNSAICQDVINVYYGDYELSLSYHNFPFTEDSSSFTNKMKGANESLLMNDLMIIKKEFKLNDWYYYQLLDQLSRSVYGHEDEQFNLRTLLKWYLLNRSGYDARIVNVYGLYGLFILSEWDIVNSIEIEGVDNEKFIPLNVATLLIDSVLTINDPPKTNAQLFSLELDYPRSIESKQDHIIECQIGDSVLNLETFEEFDLMFLLEQYPSLEDNNRLFNIDFSENTTQGIITTLKSVLVSDQLSNVIFLYDYVHRISLNDDLSDSWFGYKRKLIPELVIYYGGGDLLDKSGLLYALMKKLLDLPLIILENPLNEDEVVIGVYVEGLEYKGLEYNERKYLILDLREEKLDLENPPKRSYVGYTVTGSYLSK